MKKLHKNQRGFSHHFILPLLAFIAVGAIGGYVISRSSAASVVSKDIVYSVFPEAGGNAEDFKFYHYNTTATTQYPANVTDVIDTSIDRKWVLTNSYETNDLAAYTNDGQKVSYGYKVDYRGMNCSEDYFYVKDAKFAKTLGTSAPTVYFIGVTEPCENGLVNTDKRSVGFYSSDANGANKKVLSTPYASGSVIYSYIDSVATNGNVLVMLNSSFSIISSTGKTVLKVSKAISSGSIFMSENGKKIAYEKNAAIYLANSDGKKSKKLMSTSGNGRFLRGISPTGSYILYQKVPSKGYKYNLYSYRVSTKKSQLLDSGSEAAERGHNSLWSEHWLSGQDTIYYVKEASETKKVEIKQVNMNGKGKKTIFSSPFSDKKYLELF